MFKKLLTVMLVLIGISSIVVGQTGGNKKFIGKWAGTYEGNGETHNASVTFIETDGKLTGLAESTEKADGIPIPVENIVINGNTIKFELLSSIKYEGTFVESKNSIEGILTGMDGGQTKLNLIKEIPKPEKNDLSRFAGTWNATVTGGNGEQLIIVVLKEKDGILAGTIEVPTQNSGPFPLDSLKVETNKLSFEIMGGTVTFVGSLDAEKKMIAGVGSENGNEFTIIFNKEEKIPVKK